MILIIISDNTQSASSQKKDRYLWVKWESRFDIKRFKMKHNGWNMI